MFCLFVHLLDFRSRFGRTKRVGSRSSRDTQFNEKGGRQNNEDGKKIGLMNLGVSLETSHRILSLPFLVTACHNSSTYSPLTISLTTSKDRHRKKKRSKKTCLQQRD